MDRMLSTKTYFLKYSHRVDEFKSIIKWLFYISLITVFILFNVYTDILKIMLNVDDNDMHIDFQFFGCGFHSNYGHWRRIKID